MGVPWTLTVVLVFFFFSSTTLLLPTHFPPPLYTHAQSCSSMDFSLPDSSVHGLFQARILEWVAISFSITVVLISIFLVISDVESLIFKVGSQTLHFPLLFLLGYCLDVCICNQLKIQNHPALAHWGLAFLASLRILMRML